MYLKVDLYVIPQIKHAGWTRWENRWGVCLMFLVYLGGKKSIKKHFDSLPIRDFSFSNDSYSLFDELWKNDPEGGLWPC